MYRHLDINKSIIYNTKKLKRLSEAYKHSKYKLLTDKNDAYRHDINKQKIPPCRHN